MTLAVRPRSRRPASRTLWLRALHYRWNGGRRDGWKGAPRRDRCREQPCAPPRAAYLDRCITLHARELLLLLFASGPSAGLPLLSAFCQDFPVDLRLPGPTLQPPHGGRPQQQRSAGPKVRMGDGGQERGPRVHGWLGWDNTAWLSLPAAQQRQPSPVSGQPEGGVPA